MALRVTIGWHFFHEGQSKLSEGFTSKHFLLEAKGPLAGLYYGAVPDYDGTQRFDLDATLHAWGVYRDQIDNHFKLDKAQKEKTAAIYDQYAGMLKGLLPESGRDPGTEAHLEFREKYDEYQQDLAWLEQAHESTSDNQVEFQEAHIAEREAKVKALRGQLLTQIDALWESYEQTLNEEGDAQPGDSNYYPLARPGEHSFDLRFADWFIPRLHLIVGGLLILGLFTRPAAIAAALFLLSVIATQPPWVAGTISVQYQVVELLAVLAVAAVGAGRWAGLDFLLYSAYQWWGDQKKEVRDESHA